MAHYHPIFSRYSGWEGQVPSGLFIDWIGAKYPAELPAQPWIPHSRAATDLPPVDEECFEWIDLLEAVATAGPVFTFLELGAGYGRWSVRAALAARQLGKTSKLGLAEAAPKHVRSIRTMMEVNQIASSDYSIFETAVAGTSGDAWFTVEWPESKEPPQWYGQAITQNDMTGAVLIGEHEGLPLWRMRDGWGVIKVPQAPLSQVLGEFERVDLVDFDLQGAEASAIEEAIELLCQRVRRLHVGTHSHDIEAKLRDLLRRYNWECLRDFPCAQESETPFGKVAFVDGVQSWVNPRAL